MTAEDIAKDKEEYGFSLRKLSKLTKYGYSATGWKDLLLFVDGESIKYDDLGNPIIYRGSQLKWNYLRNLEKIGDIATYKYNASGIRTSKIVSETETKFYLNGNKIIAQDDGDNRLIFYYGIDGLAGFSINGVEYTYKKNIQNDITGIYDTNGNQLVKYVYDAWGNHKTFVLYQGNFVDISLENDYNDDNYQGKVQLATLNPFRYRSYYFDEETGLYYLNARYYDPEIGRFINADSISILSESKDLFNGLNLFVYCGNNPVSNIDDSGEKWWEWLIIAFVAVVVVVATVAITIATGGVATTMLIGAGIGAFIGGTTSVVSQLASGQEFNWGQFILDVVFGSITGLIGGSALGTLGSGIAMGAIGFVQSMASDLATTGSVDYGKAVANGIFSGILGAKAGAQHGLTGHTAALRNSLKNVNAKVAAGGYSVRGGNGAKNLVKYYLNRATNVLKTKSFGILMSDIISTNYAGEEIFKFLFNSLF